MTIKGSWSQRLLRQGPLAEETHHVFSGWRFEEDIGANLDRGVSGRFNTQGWEKEVRTTIRARLRDIGRMKPLIQLAKGPLPFDDWRDCLRLWIVATEKPFGSFVMDWLDPERLSGRSHVRSDDVRPFVEETWVAAGKRPLTPNGLIKTSRDLLKSAADLKLLNGTAAVKTLSPPSMGEDALLFHVHLIAELEGSAARVVESPYWRSAFMSPSDVHAALLRLHQFRRLDYQVAGSLVQLSLPYGSAVACAEAVAA